MSDEDLFHPEREALEAACAVATRDGLPATAYQDALRALADRYARLMRESQRLIARSDRAERALNDSNRQLQSLAHILEHKATHDPLTDIYNRGAIIERVCQALKQSSASLIVLDIDYFKRINDRYGHPRGDAVIRELVQRIQQFLQTQGYMGRVGGEEFTILLPAAPLALAVSLAERIRADLAALPLAALPEEPVTASFGVSWNPCGASFDDAYGLADAALYRAKRQGRNRVESAPALQPAH